jgi:molybdopterin biosynthesis enzyme
VAEAKVTPLVVSAREVAEAESYASTPPIRVLPFKSMRAGALIRERVSHAQAQRVVESLSGKLAWFGSSLGGVRYVSPDEPAERIAAEMRGLLAEGSDLLFVSGGSAADPADPLLKALGHVPARVERVGIPAHPGSMLWLGYAGEVPILGVPSCGMFSQATTLDLVLPAALAGESLTASTFASIGHGGLLRGNDPRFPRYNS